MLRGSYILGVGEERLGLGLVDLQFLGQHARGFDNNARGQVLYRARPVQRLLVIRLLDPEGFQR
jgi:hypothetical protein